MYCDCIAAVLLHNLLSFNYYYNKESIEILLLCSWTLMLLLFTKIFDNKMQGFSRNMRRTS